MRSKSKEAKKSGRESDSFLKKLIQNQQTGQFWGVSPIDSWKTHLGNFFDFHEFYSKCFSKIKSMFVIKDHISKIFINKISPTTTCHKHVLGCSSLSHKIILIQSDYEINVEELFIIRSESPPILLKNKIGAHKIFMDEFFENRSESRPENFSKNWMTFLKNGQTYDTISGWVFQNLQIRVHFSWGENFFFSYFAFCLLLSSQVIKNIKKTISLPWN